MTRLTVNGQAHDIDVDSDTPLLWALRDTLGLMGTKFGCGIAQCGACTVHVDGAPVRSCALPVGAVGDKHITTIEGLGSDDALHPVQRAWVELDVPQCGYCQSGMIMPPYYRIEGLIRVAPAFQGKTILTAEQIEDVVAYLATLRDEHKP